MTTRDLTPPRWEDGRLRADSGRIAARLRALEAEVEALEHAKRALEQEVVQHRRAEELARDQSQMLIESLGILAAENDSKWFFYEGNYREYENNKIQRLGEEAAKPHRVRFKALK